MHIFTIIYQLIIWPAAKSDPMNIYHLYAYTYFYMYMYDLDVYVYVYTCIYKYVYTYKYIYSMDDAVASGSFAEYMSIYSYMICIYT